MTTDPFGVVAVIPARWDSTRFPGKVLAGIAGEPMIAHVVRRASAAATVDHVVVAADDERVAAAAIQAGAEAVMTGSAGHGAVSLTSETNAALPPAGSGSMRTSRRSATAASAGTSSVTHSKPS